MNSIKFSILIGIFAASFVSGTDEGPVISSIGPNSVVPRQIVAVQGDHLEHATVVWNAGRSGEMTADVSYQAANYFQIPTDAVPGTYPVRLSRESETSANAVDVTVRQLLGTWPAPRIEDLTYKVISTTAGTTHVKLALFLAVANVDAKAEVSINNTVQQSSLYSAITSNYFQIHKDSTFGYPIFHYGQLIVPLDSDFGSTLHIIVKNIDGLTDSFEFILPDSEAEVDSDNDGLLDSWEINGYHHGSTTINLAAMGCNPFQKDILVEVDWMKDCKPSDGIWPRIEHVYKNAPVLNPDGSQGINIHIDHDSTDTRFANSEGNSGGHTIPLHETIDLQHHPTTARYISFYTLKKDRANFDSARKAIFHYCVFGFADKDGGSGSGEIWGNDFYITLKQVSAFLCGELMDPTTEIAEAGTFVHELGHNLGLRHGGPDNGAHDENETFKPNQPSSMNYRYQLPGVSNDCDLTSNGDITYSQGMLRSINERRVRERIGICDNHPLSFSCADSPNEEESEINVNLGGDDDSSDILIDYDEWGHIKMNFANSGSKWKGN